MIHVPELKTGDRPFEPDFEQSMNPGNNDAADAAENNTPTPEQRIAVMLNLAVVKEAVTAIHRDEDKHMRQLESFSSSRICDIPAEHAVFLRERMTAGENACKNEEQKALFRAMIKPFLAQSRERALGLQYRKTAEYWRETVEEQNREFLARALREENVANNAALAMYRDLIFYNLENMLAYFPEGEKKEKLNIAAAAFYQKVLEKRLEQDPAGTLAMTEKKEVRRNLGDAACAELTEKAVAALREMELEAVAGTWVAEKKTPEEAEHAARAAFGDEAERKYAVERYSLGRFEENKTKVAATMTNITTAWDRLKENNYDENTLPGWVVRNEPALAVCLRECARRRGDAGGGEGKIDYPQFIPFLRSFARGGLWKTMEYLREEEECHALLLSVGNPDASAWALCVRFLGGVAREEDREYVAALLLAWGEGKSQEYMERFAEELGRMEEKSALAVLALARRVGESFGETQ